MIKELRELFGDQRLSQITYLDLETYRNRQKATPTKAGKPRADASVNRDMAILGHMLSKAAEWGLLEASPFKKCKTLMLKENNQRLRFLTEAEIDSLLTACTPHLRPIVETALLSGMRRGELPYRREMVPAKQTPGSAARRNRPHGRRQAPFRRSRNDY